MLSLSLPLPIVGGAGLELEFVWGQGPVSNSLTLGLMTQEETEPHPTVLGGGRLCGELSSQRCFFPNFSHSGNNFKTFLSLNSYPT